jgi:ketosteroid isomerase-like protein
VRIAVFLALMGGLASASNAATLGTAELTAQLRQTESAFAKTMADRDHAGFNSFLADDTVFMGPTTLRGKAAVAAAWKRYYEGPKAPFAWKPDRVEVLDSGTLGMTSGPVFDEAGQRVGTFNSVWRRDKDGRWRIVFDIGCPSCEATPAPPPTPAPSPAR